MINFYYADPAVHGYGHKVRTEALAACFGETAEVWDNQHVAGGVQFLDAPDVPYTKRLSVCVTVSDNLKPGQSPPALVLEPWELVRDQFFGGKFSNPTDGVSIFIGSGPANDAWAAKYVDSIKESGPVRYVTRSSDNESASTLAFRMRDCSVNIVTAGMMAYEALATGTPTLVVDPAKIWDVPSVPTVIDPRWCFSFIQAYEVWPGFIPTKISETAEKLRWFLKGVEACGR